MSFVLTEEQESIRNAARDLVAQNAPIASFRALRDERDPSGFSRLFWKELAALGFCGLTLPEAFGGIELGFAELGLVLEECGRALSPTPFLSTVVLCGGALAMAGTEAQKREHLPAIAAGERILALALQEGPHHAPHRVATRATNVGDGFRLDGAKVLVLDGHLADALVVEARTSGAVDGRDGITLFLVHANAPGLTIERTALVDARNAARVRLDGVRVDRSSILGALDRGADVLDPLLDRAAIALSGEMLGGTQEAFDRTIAYLKVRKQFGVPIGSFQALKHRAAQMFCEVELSKSIVMEALRAIDQGRADVAALASAAKARLSDVFVHVTAEAIQLHGGVGVTDEVDIGLFYKRARACDVAFGNAAHHRDRFARLGGY